MGRQEETLTDGGGREALEGDGRAAGEEEPWSGGLPLQEAGISRGPPQPHRGTLRLWGGLCFCGC